MLVVFTNTIEFFSIAVCIGTLPVTEHVTLSPAKARTTAGINIFGGAGME